MVSVYGDRAEDMMSCLVRRVLWAGLTSPSGTDSCLGMVFLRVKSLRSSVGPESRRIMMGSYGFLRGLRLARCGLPPEPLADEGAGLRAGGRFFSGMELVRWCDTYRGGGEWHFRVEKCFGY